MKTLLVLFSFLLLSCGVREVKDAPYDDTNDRLLVGSWEKSGTTNCQDQLSLNADKTFKWAYNSALFSGNYTLQANQLSFLFAQKAEELAQFVVGSRELDLYRNGVKSVYFKVPADSAACLAGPSDPVDPKPLPPVPGQKPVPKPLPPPPVPDQKPSQKPDQKPIPTVQNPAI